MNPFDEYTNDDAQAVASNVQPSSSNPFDEYSDNAPVQPQEQAPKVKGEGTPESPYSAIIEFSDKIQEAREVGRGGFREAALGHAVAAGNMTLEEAESQISADTKLAEMSADLEQYEKDSWDSWITGIPTSITISTVKSLPMLEESLKPFGVGAALGGGAALATGAGAPFAAPVAGMTGTAVASGWAADLITGQEYLQRRRQGIPHDEALAASNISGVIQGMLQGLRFGSTGKAALDTAKNVMQAHMQTMANFMADAGKFGAIQIGLGEAQTATRLIADAIAATVGKTPDAMPTMEKAIDEFSRTFRETLASSAGMFLGTKAIGTGLGLTGKSLVKVARTAANKHIENQAAKVERFNNSVNGGVNGDSSKAAQNEVAARQKFVGKNPTTSAIEKRLRAATRLEQRLAHEAEINRIISAADSLFTIDREYRVSKSGKVYRETAKQETARLQKLVKNLVTRSDKLDDKMKIKLLKRVPEIDGTPALLRMGQAIIEEMRGREYANELAAADARLKGAIKSGQPKSGKAVIDNAAAQQSLKWYDEFFSLPKKMKPEEAKQAALQRAREFMENGVKQEIEHMQAQVEQLDQGKIGTIFDPVAELSEKLRIATEASNYFADLLSPEEIHELAESVETTVKTGKADFLERKQREAERLLTDRAKVLEAHQGAKPVTPSDSASPPKEMNLVGKVMNSMRRNESALWDKLLQDTKPEDRQAIIDKILSITEAENKEHELIRKASEDLSDRYEEAVGSLREAKRLIRNASNKKQRIAITYTDIHGESQTKHFTVDQLVRAHMAFEDKGAVPGLMHGNKFTLEGMVEDGQTSTQEAIRAFLETHEEGKYLKLAGAVQDHYRWFAPFFSNHYLKEYGVKPKMEPTYSGRIKHRQVERIKSMTDLLNGVHDFAKQSLDPASAKERSDSKLPLFLDNPFEQVVAHQNEMAFWIANSDKARQLSFIFSDTSENGLRDVITHKLSSDYLNLIDGRLAFQFHLKPGIMDIADRPLADVRGKFSVSILGNRPDQRVKQLTGVFAPLRTCTWAEWREGFVKSQTDKKAVAEYLKHSELYRERQEHTVKEMMQIADRSFLDKLTGDRAFEASKFFMRDMHWGDGVAAKVGGFIEYNRLRKGGATPEEAALGADRLVDQTMASSRAGQKTPNEFKKGQSALNAAFQKEAIQAFNRQAAAVRDAMIHRDPETIKRAARIWFSVVAAQTMFETINNTPAFIVGDDQDKQQAMERIGLSMMFGALTRVPGLGWDLATIAQGKEPRTMSGAIAGDASKFFKKVWKIANQAAEGEDVELDGETAWTTMKALALAQGWWTSLPIYPVFKYLELGGDIAKKAGGEE